MVIPNEYEQYAKLANDNKVFAENRIQNELDSLDKLSKYEDVENFIEENYGSLTDKKLNLFFPGNIELAIRQEENTIEIVAIQGEYVIFSKGWRIVKKQQEDK